MNQVNFKEGYTAVWNCKHCRSFRNTSVVNVGNNKTCPTSAQTYWKLQWKRPLSKPNQP